jgi:hypothetical protein
VNFVTTWPLRGDRNQVDWQSGRGLYRRVLISSGSSGV